MLGYFTLYRHPALLGSRSSLTSPPSHIPSFHDPFSFPLATVTIATNYLMISFPWMFHVFSTHDMMTRPDDRVYSIYLCIALSPSPPPPHHITGLVLITSGNHDQPCHHDHRPPPTSLLGANSRVN